MAVDTKKRNSRQQNWVNENKERINLLFEKGTKERLTQAAAASGVSLSEYVRSAINSKLKEDNF
ncbi:MAG: hypothetical protein IKV25_01250 [Clostridia bacterium]|nr:hypothetical protein [Bacteroidaceae bacterium]MBR4794317.1 hypothetical protein [Bacteroidaceae bacterium]MBR5245980.1 hypothetical protein [Clostridia bacterium]